MGNCTEGSTRGEKVQALELFSEGDGDPRSGAGAEGGQSIPPSPQTKRPLTHAATDRRFDPRCTSPRCGRVSPRATARA
jgi:hypothetical protein